MASSDGQQLPLAPAEPKGFLTPGASLQDATEWLRSCGVLTEAVQALVTLNDPQFVEAARQLAQQALLESAPSFRHRLSFVAGRLLARDFTPAEQEVIEQSLDQLAEFYAAHADETEKLLTVGESKADPKLPRAELAAWTMVVNQLMNLDETLNK